MSAAAESAVWGATVGRHTRLLGARDSHAGGRPGPLRNAVSGEKVAVEWWTTMWAEGEEITIPGCLLLRFAPDGRCEELREYWHVEPGGHEPPDGWGR